MRLDRGLVLLLAAPAVVIVACAGGPSVRPSVAVAADASPDSATSLARQCTPWAEPVAAAAPDPDRYPSSGRHDKPADAKDLCATADSNLARAEARIEGGAAGVLAKSRPWDHVQKPERLDLVDHRYKLTKRERAMLGTNGFVVLDRRGSSTFAWALHDVYQSQLPLYVSADAILHAVYASNDHLLAQIERDLLVPRLGSMLSKLHCALAEAGGAYPPEVARDLDLYLTVARSLLADAPVPSVLGADGVAAEHVAAAKKASGIATVSLFGRDRLVDWSAYLPRGHYAAPAAPEPDPDGNGAEPAPSADGPPPLTAYFRAAMWLSRIELNLVSRSSRSSSPTAVPDPTETPREAIAALALADLVDRAHGVDDVARLDRAWTLLAGRREDVTIADLLHLRQKMGIARIDLAAFDRLKAAVGNDFQRTARLHPMPEGSTVLPAIATLLGPRVVADTAAFRPLVNGEVPGRYLVGPGDVAYVLGLDHGKAFLADDLKQFPSLAAQLDVARGKLRSAPDAGDLYGAWLAAVRGIAAPTTGTVPSFMHGAAYDDLRVNSLVAGYGQIRHNYVLMAGQSYDEGGCQIPDGWVEPLPAVYEGLTTYAERGAKALAELDPKDTTGSGAYFAELAKVTRILATIARHELEGRTLSVEEKRFLSMVVEMTPGGTGGPPTYTGWYFDLFRGRQDEALTDAAFTADYHTSSFLGKVAYAGVTGPRLGLFVVDTGGPPRVMVGPVARAYGMVGSVDKRFDDTTGRAATDLHASPWATSYTAPTPPQPAFSLAASFESQTIKLVLRSKAALPQVVIEATDHHGVAVATLTRSLPPDGRLFLTITPPKPADGVRVRIGEHVLEGSISGPSTTVSLESGGLQVDSEDWAATN